MASSASALAQRTWDGGRKEDEKAARNSVYDWPEGEFQAKHHDDQPDLGLRESTGHSLLQLFGELHHLGSQRHAGLHHHQVPGAQGVSVALGALGGLFPCMVLHGDIGSIFNQGLSENAETGDCIRTSL